MVRIKLPPTRKKSSDEKADEKVGVNKQGIDVPRLRGALERSRIMQQDFREERFATINRLCGKHYKKGRTNRRPLNLIALFVTIYHRQLAAGRPGCFVETDIEELRPYALDYEIRMNQRIGEMNLEGTIKSAVLDALIGLGVVKSGWAVDENGNGAWFCDCVHLDDWVHDMVARKWYETQFKADRYEMNFDSFMASKLFSNKKGLRPTQDIGTNQEGDPRVHTISGEVEAYSDRFEKTIELWDVYLPRLGKVVTIPAEGGIEPLRVVDWKGPAIGPYIELCYGDVPDNTMPLAPTANLIDLDDLANVLLNKVGQQAIRQKTIGTFMGNADDAARINKTKDGEWANVTNPQAVKEAKFGGPDAVLLAFFLQVKDMFNYESGNLDSVAGLSPQSRTLGQDQMLNASASQGLAEMSDRTMTFVGKILESGGWYEWHDPQTDTMLYKKVPGYDSGVFVPWSPGARVGQHSDYRVKFQPYSMMHTTPQMKLQGITNFLSEYIAPFAPMLATQGKSIDFDFLCETAARLTNTPELEHVLTSMDQQTTMQMNGGGGDGMESSMSPVTKREYNRTSTQSTSRSGRDQTLSRALLGVKSQGSEMAGAGL